MSYNILLCAFIVHFVENLMTDAIDIAFAKAKADEYLAHAKAILPASLPADIKDAYEQVAEFIGDRDF